jgi:hypothetical protein
MIRTLPVLEVLMPRRVDIAWGRSGFIVRGFGQTNKQFSATHAGGDSKERLVGGTIFSDVEFAELARHLQFDATSILEHQVRAQLDVIREFMIKALLDADQKPKPVSVHRALKLLIQGRASYSLACTPRLRRALHCAINYRRNGACQSHNHGIGKIVRAFMAPTTSSAEGQSEALT